LSIPCIVGLWRITRVSTLSMKCFVTSNSVVCVSDCFIGTFRIRHSGTKSYFTSKYPRLSPRKKQHLPGFLFQYVCTIAKPISRQVLSNPSRQALETKTKITRRCSFCGELGHNSRTCNNNHIRDRQHIEKCPRCRGSGVIPCPLCTSNHCYDQISNSSCEEHVLAASTFELANFSKLKFVYKGKSRRQVCTKCGGSALTVCPDCFGLV